MKKLLLIVVLAVGLGGCATVQKIVDTTSAVVVGVNNPISNNELYALENSMIVAFAGLNAYKRACIAGAVGSGCRDVIARLQVHTRKIPPALKRLRAFVRNNDRVNAITAYNEVRAMIDLFKAEASANGVRVQ